MLSDNVGRMSDDDIRIRLPHLFIAYLLKMSLGRKKIRPGLTTIDACVKDLELQNRMRSVSSELRKYYGPYDKMTETFGSVKRFHSSLHDYLSSLSELYRFFIKKESESCTADPRWHDHFPDLRNSLALLQERHSTILVQTVKWDDEWTEEEDCMEDGLVLVSQKSWMFDVIRGD